MGFEASAKRKISEKLMKRLQQKAPEIAAMTTTLGKQSFDELRVIDTGEGKADFRAEAFVTSKSLTIRMSNTLERLVYPLLGLGRHRETGPRDWFALTANKLLKKLGIKTGVQKAKQPASYKSLLKAKKGYKVKTLNKKSTANLKPGTGFKVKSTRTSKTGRTTTSFIPK